MSELSDRISVSRLIQSLRPAHIRLQYTEEQKQQVRQRTGKWYQSESEMMFMRTYATDRGWKESELRAAMYYIRLLQTVDRAKWLEGPIEYMWKPAIQDAILNVSFTPDVSYSERVITAARDTIRYKSLYDISNSPEKEELAKLITLLGCEASGFIHINDLTNSLLIPTDQERCRNILNNKRAEDDY